MVPNGSHKDVDVKPTSRQLTYSQRINTLTEKWGQGWKKRGFFKKKFLGF